MSTKQSSLTGEFEDPVVVIDGESMQVREMDAEQYLVINQTKDSQYVVDDAGCSCPAFEFHEGDCKHMCAVAEVDDESEAGNVPPLHPDFFENKDVFHIDCPDCGGQATAAQWDNTTVTSYGNTGQNIERKTRILCSDCGTVREEDDNAYRRDL